MPAAGGTTTDQGAHVRVLASIGLTAALVVGAAAPTQLPAAAGSPAGEAAPLGTGDGFVPAATWTARQDAYLAYATETVDLGSPSNVTAHLARSERDPGYDFDGTALQPADLANIFAKIDGLEDTSDFDMMRLTLLWWAYRDRLDPDTVAAIEQRFSGFRYWFTDPLPEGVVDDKWFWSENHRLIVHTLEYLSGRALPDTTFDFTGEPGSVHAARGRERIEEWLDEKVAFGFSEWHSDVYYAKDIEPLLLLTEFAEDDIAQRAAAMLDMFLYDLAVHQRAGNVGVTHGRSYMKDKSRAVDQDVFNAVKLAFDTTSKPYTSRRRRHRDGPGPGRPVPAAGGDRAAWPGRRGPSSTVSTWASPSTSMSRSPPPRRRPPAHPATTRRACRSGGSGAPSPRGRWPRRPWPRSTSTTCSRRRSSNRSSPWSTSLAATRT